MEQLIIFLLFVVGSIISSIIQHKKKKAEEQQQRELEELTRRGRGEQKPPSRAEAPFPKTAADWQDQLRRMLEGEVPPQPKPPVIKPILLPPVLPESQPKPTPKQREQRQQRSSRESRKEAAPAPRPPQREIIVQREASEGDVEFRSPLKTSAAHYERASKLQATVEERMRAVSQQTTTHKPAQPTRPRPHPQSEVMRRLRRNPRAIREAFIASLIFGPPKSLEPEETVRT